MGSSLDFQSLTRHDLQGVGFGISSQIFRIRNTNIVAKVPLISPIFGPELHGIEKKIYERINGDHPNILRYLGQSPPGCKILKGALLFEYHPRGNLKDCINQLHGLTTRPHRLQYQAASALAYIHSIGVVHTDFGLHNILLRNNGNIVLCDFAGSGLDGGRSHVAHGTRYYNPLSPHDYPTKQDDVFALGSVLYELERGALLFEGLADAEIVSHFRDKRFPDLSDVEMPLRGVIERCWTVPKYTAAEAARELELKTTPH